MILKTVLLSAFLLSTGCKTTTVPPASTLATEKKQQQQPPKKMLLLLGALDQEMDKVVKSSPNMEEIKYLDENMMINASSVTVNHQKLSENLAKIYPDRNATGFCYLNVETPYIEMIRDKDENDPEFKKGMALFLDIIRTLKKQRPNVKFGFYAVPFTTFWETGLGFFNKHQKIAPLLKEVDVFFPSMYMFYDDGIVGLIKNRDFLESNIKEALILGSRYNKPVYPFVMHRYHPSSGKIAWKLLSDKEWSNYISTISTLAVNGRSVNGIVWWGPDSYYYSVGTKEFRNEFKGTQAQFQRYNDKNLVRKAMEAKKILNQ